jgi:hypothetical protein
LKKIPTGIVGFDQILYGGLPKNRNSIISRGSGTGKTVIIENPEPTVTICGNLSNKENLLSI